MDDSKKDLGIAYAVKRRNKMAKGGVAAHCPACLQAGGKCEAHMSQGGMPEQMPAAASSVTDSIMKKRHAKKAPGVTIHLSTGGAVESPEDDFEDETDFSFLPEDADDSTTGEAHDADNTDEVQDDSLVGQIMKRRAQKKS